MDVAQTLNPLPQLLKEQGKDYLPFLESQPKEMQKSLTNFTFCYRFCLLQFVTNFGFVLNSKIRINGIPSLQPVSEGLLHLETKKNERDSAKTP